MLAKDANTTDTYIYNGAKIRFVNISGIFRNSKILSEIVDRGSRIAFDMTSSNLIYVSRLSVVDESKNISQYMALERAHKSGSRIFCYTHGKWVIMQKDWRFIMPIARYRLEEPWMYCGFLEDTAMEAFQSEIESCGVADVVVAIEAEHGFYIDCLAPTKWQYIQNTVYELNKEVYKHVIS